MIEQRTKANKDVSVDKRDARTTEPDIAAFIESTDERLNWLEQCHEIDGV